MLLAIEYRIRTPRRRKAVVVVQVAVLSVVLIGFSALVVDVGVMYNAKADLQRTADAAALAAAARLSDFEAGDPVELARDTALEYTQRNAVLGQNVTLDTTTDVEFGRATFNTATQQYDFDAGAPLPDAVRVRVRKTDDSPNGSLSLYFASALGFHSTELSAEAIAVMVPRDIAIVADLSASHNDDSEFRHYRETDINIYDVWNGLPGGADEIDSLWDLDSLPPEWIEPDGSVPQAAGPAWGFMQELGWGTDQIDENYDPTADEGLIRLAYNNNWNDAQLSTFLADQGYIPSEVDAIMSRSYDSNGAYKYRVATALGLTFWNSGHPGGLWEQRGVDPGDTGNGNNWVGGGEMEWTATIFEKSLSTSRGYWLDYINKYMNKTWTQLYDANSDFRYRFGAKTFTNYLMERKSSNSQTPELNDTTTQPMQAVKDAVEFMVSLIDDLDTDDQLSLEIYGTTARHEIDLTFDHQAISNRLNEMQAGHYDGWTNMGGGLQRAIDELTGSRARGASRKVIILLTDGNANVSETGSVGDYPGGAAYALDRAGAANELGMRIFAVSVGSGANTSLMQQIADIGNGEHFRAEGSIDQYSAQLVEIFQRLGSARQVELIQ